MEVEFSIASEFEDFGMIPEYTNLCNRIRGVVKGMSHMTQGGERCMRRDGREGLLYTTKVSSKRRERIGKLRIEI